MKISKMCTQATRRHHRHAQDKERGAALALMLLNVFTTRCTPLRPVLHRTATVANLAATPPTAVYRQAKLATHSPSRLTSQQKQATRRSHSLLEKRLLLVPELTRVHAAALISLPASQHDVLAIHTQQLRSLQVSTEASSSFRHAVQNVTNSYPI
jgi:hypothetical protein